MIPIDRYFEELGRCLSRLSEQDRDASLRFYREYAEDAGLTHYEDLTNHFGSPKALASQILADSAVKHVQPDSSDHGSTWKGFLLGLAALFSLPLSFPVLICSLSVSFGLIVSIAAILFSAAVAILSLGGVSIALFIKSFDFLIPLQPVLWLKSMGGALILFGLTAALGFVLLLIGRFLFKTATLLISKFIKRRNHHE